MTCLTRQLLIQCVKIGGTLFFFFFFFFQIYLFSVDLLALECYFKHLDVPTCHLVLDYVCICICIKYIADKILLYILSCVVMFIILLARFFIARTIISHITNFRYKDKLANANMIPLLGGFTVFITFDQFSSCIMSLVMLCSDELTIG